MKSLAGRVKKYCEKSPSAPILDAVKFHQGKSIKTALIPGKCLRNSCVSMRAVPF